MAIRLESFVFKSGFHLGNELHLDLVASARLPLCVPSSSIETITTIATTQSTTAAAMVPKFIYLVVRRKVVLMIGANNFVRPNHYAELSISSDYNNNWARPFAFYPCTMATNSLTNDDNNDERLLYRGAVIQRPAASNGRKDVWQACPSGAGPTRELYARDVGRPQPQSSVK